MTQPFADITHRQGEPNTPAVVSPKTRRLNVASMKLARDIRMAVLAHDPRSLRAALKAAEDLHLDTHLIKAARTSLIEMEAERDTNDENSAPPTPSNAQEGSSKAAGNGSRSSVVASFMKSKHPAFPSPGKVQSPVAKRALYKGAAVVAPSSETDRSEGEHSPEKSAPIAYTVAHPLFDDGKAHPAAPIRGPAAMASGDAVSETVRKFRNEIQPQLSARIARIRLESAKLDVSCKDLCAFIRAAHGAQEASVFAHRALAEDINQRAFSKSGLTIDVPWLLIRGQLMGRAERDMEALQRLRLDAMLPAAIAIPAIETEIRSLFEEAVFLETECIKAMTEIDRCMPRPADGEDAASQQDVSTHAEGSMLSATIRRLRKPSDAASVGGEEGVSTARIEAEVTFKRVFNEYLTRLPVIIGRIATLNAQRLKIVKKSLTTLVASRQRQLETEADDHQTLTEVVSQIDVEKDLKNLVELTGAAGCVGDDDAVADDLLGRSWSNHLSLAIVPSPGSASNASTDAIFFDAARPRSYAVDLWAGSGFDIALEHAVATKGSVSNLQNLLKSWSSALYAQSETLSRAARDVQAGGDEGAAYVGDTQTHAEQVLLRSTQTKATCYMTCANLLRQAGVAVREHKGNIKRVCRSVAEGRARATKELQIATAHEAKCKETRDRLEKDLSATMSLVQDGASSYGPGGTTCQSQAQLEVLLAQLEREERAFRHADLVQRNALHSLQTMRETYAIMQCQFLQQLQRIEQGRLFVIASAIRDLGQGIRDLVNTIEQADLDTIAAFAAIDLDRDLQQFVSATYPGGTRAVSPSAPCDYVTELSADGFDPAFAHAMSGLAQMKSMLLLLDASAETHEQTRSLARFKLSIHNQELPAVHDALVQCQHLVQGVCQSIEDHCFRHREIMASVSKQRHALKAQARDIRKRFQNGHRRVTQATQAHAAAVDAQRRSTERLQIVKAQQAGSASGAPPADASANQTMSSRIARLFSRDPSKTLIRTEHDVHTSKSNLERSMQELAQAISDRESTVQSALRGLQDIEANRVSSLQWCVPVLMDDSHAKGGEIAELAQALLNLSATWNGASDLVAFIKANSSGVAPPPFLLTVDWSCDPAEDARLCRPRTLTISYESTDDDDEHGAREGSTHSAGTTGNDSTFGGSLECAPKRNGVAKVVSACIAFLSVQGMQSPELLFRDSAPPEEVHALVRAFQRDQDLPLVTQTVECVAAVLKLYVSQLNPSLIPSTMASEFMSIYKNASASRRCEKAQVWLAKLPEANRNTLKLLLLFLSETARSATRDSVSMQMAVTNLAISWSPVLLRSAVGSTIQAVARLIHDTPAIFSDTGVAYPAPGQQ